MILEPDASIKKDLDTMIEENLKPSLLSDIGLEQKDDGMTTTADSHKLDPVQTGESPRNNKVTTGTAPSNINDFVVQEAAVLASNNSNNSNSVDTQRAGDKSSSVKDAAEIPTPAETTIDKAGVSLIVPSSTSSLRIQGNLIDDSMRVRVGRQPLAEPSFSVAAIASLDINDVDCGGSIMDSSIHARVGNQLLDTDNVLIGLADDVSPIDDNSSTLHPRQDSSSELSFDDIISEKQRKTMNVQAMNENRSVSGREFHDALKTKMKNNDLQSQRNIVDPLMDREETTAIPSDCSDSQSKTSVKKGGKTVEGEVGLSVNNESSSPPVNCDFANPSATSGMSSSARVDGTFKNHINLAPKTPKSLDTELAVAFITDAANRTKYDTDNHTDDSSFKGEQNIGRSPREARSPMSTGSSGYDKTRLNERLRQRLAKRSEMRASGAKKVTLSPVQLRRINGTLTNNENVDETSSTLSTDRKDRSLWETRLTQASRRRLVSRSQSDSGVFSDISKESNDNCVSKTRPNISSLLNPHETSQRDNADILAKYGISPRGPIGEFNIYPDTVTFSDGEDEDDLNGTNGSRTMKSRQNYRKTYSEVGTSSMPSRDPRSKISRHQHPHHDGIGILQADGIVFDDALLLRLARFGRMRGEMPTVTDDETLSSNGERRYNEVKIHVYDLLMKDALVEMPYFNCNFPIGQCFKVMNNGLHCLGTGAYHVGVEVNGIEYAFGANKIVGMSGIFTCTPKESPGYEFRETLDFGKVRTTKKTWIRIPKEKMFDQSISSVLGVSHDSCDKEAKETVFADPSQTPTGSQQSYFFREIETFTDGHAVIHSMAREYLGTDYDLLRKNCCTFSRDVCLRMGVKEEDIPSWFHNAAKAGADAEDVIANAEQSVKTMFDCAYDSDHNIEYEGIGHGFEVVADKEHANFKVIETTPTWDGRFSSQRQPLLDNDEQLNDQVRETISWTY